MGILGYYVAAMVAPPAICGSSLGGNKDTESCCRDSKEELNEEEEPWKRIRAETITKSPAPPGIVSMFKLLPQTDNQLSKVYVKHIKCFWCAICDIHVKNRDDCDFTIGRWGENKRNGGHEKSLLNKIAIAELNKI